MTEVIEELSLRKEIDSAARALGIGEGVLRAHYRCLIDTGLLKAVPGKGPGSGVRYSAADLALVLITWFANLKPSQIVAVENSARELAKARNAT